MTSAFAEQLEKIPSRPPGPPCPVAEVLDKLDEASRRDVVAALEQRSGYTAPQIVKALKAMSHDVSQWSLAKHRRGDCRCFA